MTYKHMIQKEFRTLSKKKYVVRASAEQFSNKSLFIKTVLVTSSNLQLTFFIVLWRVCLSPLYMG